MYSFFTREGRKYSAYLDTVNSPLNPGKKNLNKVEITAESALKDQFFILSEFGLFE